MKAMQYAIELQEEEIRKECKNLLSLRFQKEEKEID